MFIFLYTNIAGYPIIQYLDYDCTISTLSPYIKSIMGHL